MIPRQKNLNIIVKILQEKKKKCIVKTLNLMSSKSKATK